MDYNLTHKPLSMWNQECSPGQPTLMGCYVIDVNPAALGAESISVMDFRGNAFAMPKKFSDLTPGKDRSEVNHDMISLSIWIFGFQGAPSSRPATSLGPLLTPPPRWHGGTERNISLLQENRVQFEADILALKLESRIFGQWSNPVSGSRKIQASSPWAKQHRV